jgi:hypothetical protein
MTDAIVYVDTSDVREGAVEELKEAIAELVDFVDANEPRLMAYNVYFSDDGNRMTVAHVHPDSASFGTPHGGGGAALSPVRGPRHAVIDSHLRRAKRETAGAIA